MNEHAKPPFPAQQQPIPGRTGEMRPRPDHGENSYSGSGKLKDKKAIITGGDSGIGRASGNATTEAEGAINQVKGAAQDLYGQARDNAATVVDNVRGAASSFERLFRDTIEQQPYTAAAIALGIGWLMGRSHRPL
jgi:uncharacterized protein YjbJ (UPF0337 family)